MKIQQWINRFGHYFAQLKVKPKHVPKGESKPYFEEAINWADDYYALAVASRNRYKIAFLASFALSVVLVIGIVSLSFSEFVQLVVVHTGQGGYTWVTSVKPGQKVPQSWLRTQSEIAHYVISRESYDPVLYQHQAQDVSAMSSNFVASQFEALQASSNKLSPVNELGAKGYRTVHINSIVRLNNSKTHPLAQVSFITTDHYFNATQTVKTAFTAVVSWAYQGVPDNPGAMLMNWDGFEITHYVVTPVNVTEGGIHETQMG